MARNVSYEKLEEKGFTYSDKKPEQRTHTHTHTHKAVTRIWMTMDAGTENHRMKEQVIAIHLPPHPPLRNAQLAIVDSIWRSHAQTAHTHAQTQMHAHMHTYTHTNTNTDTDTNTEMACTHSQSLLLH